MIGKKSSLNIYKIGSLVVLLGLFGLGSTFAALTIADSACKKKNTLENIVGPHYYTCQQTADKSKPAGYLCDATKNGDSKFLVDSWPADSCNVAGYICHRCICANGAIEINGKCEAKAICTSGFTLTETTNKCDCITPKKILTGNCVDVPGATATPAAADTTVKCSTNEEPNSLGQCVCKEGFKKPDNSKECVPCNDSRVCCGVELNTTVPFVGKCIRMGDGVDSGDTTVVTETTAFPRLMGALTKIMTTIILLVCFGGILAGGVMIASSGGSTTRASEGKKLIGKVVVAIAVLGASGIILHLINPNFFG